MLAGLKYEEVVYPPLITHVFPLSVHEKNNFRGRISWKLYALSRQAMCYI
jgi:hypothetical protein